MNELTYPVYFDYNATTPCLPEVVEKMIPYFSEKYVNAASKAHQQSRTITLEIEQALGHIADLIGVQPNELIVTSGATESVNLAIKGIYEAYKNKGNHIITSKSEHKAVLDTCYALEQKGAKITYLDVDRNGLIDLELLKAAIRQETILVTLMWANNETGVIQPIADIGEICHSAGVLFFSDATQAVSKIDVLPYENKIHLTAFSGHKIYGPKGVGILHISKSQNRINIQPQIHGGGHQNGLRSGTLNVPAIIGFGEACRISKLESIKKYQDVSDLKSYFESEVKKRIEEVFINGEQANRLPNTSNIYFKGINAEELMINLSSKVAVSTGSACSSASLDPSHVLKSMGCSDVMAKGVIRFSFGRDTSLNEINFLLDQVVTQVEKLRKQSVHWQMFLEGIDIDED